MEYISYVAPRQVNSVAVLHQSSSLLALVPLQCVFKIRTASAPRHHHFHTASFLFLKPFLPCWSPFRATERLYCYTSIPLTFQNASAGESLPWDVLIKQEGGGLQVQRLILRCMWLSHRNSRWRRAIFKTNSWVLCYECMFDSSPKDLVR